MMTETAKKIKERLETVWADTKYMKELLGDFRKASGIKEILTAAGKFGEKLYEYARRVVTAVEACAEDLKAEGQEMATSDDKLEAAAVFFDDQIQLPWLLEMVDGALIKALLSFAVQGLNKENGKGNAWASVARARAAIAEGR